jgi:mutator protein MutT
MEKLVDVAAAVIRRGSKVLIARRASGPRAGQWEFPGGKQEPGEDLPDCLAREIREELGMEVEIGDHLLTVEHSYPDIVIRLHAYHCIGDREEGAGKDHHQIKWVTVQELEDYDFPAADLEIARTLINQGGL